jgi:hypothetical protein
MGVFGTPQIDLSGAIVGCRGGVRRAQLYGWVGWGVLMKISLLTDAPKYNLALMKLAAYHKLCGDEVTLNDPIFGADYTYASVLFEWNRKKFLADEYGGPAFDGTKLPEYVEAMKPDYDLYGHDYSVGYTFRPCWNSCSYCKVPKMDHPDSNHHSIWEFHDSRFDKILLLNNNTFLDTQWRETFEEIWDANLTVIDCNGYDLRLLDDAKTDALHRTKFRPPIYFAWDRMVDEPLIRRGLGLLNKHKMRSTSNVVYVLIGYDTTEEEDVHRCQVIDDFGLTPYPMPFRFTKYTKQFKRFINLKYYRKYKTIRAAWNDYGMAYA